MTRWEAVSRVVDQALELDARARPAFVAQHCSGDPGLRLEVERFLTSIEHADAFLAGNAVSDAAPLLSWAAGEDLPAGTRVGSYEIIEPLGRGGTATVYLADDHKHNRRIAVKLLHPEVAATLGQEWFLREIAIAASLHHPHILPLHDSGAFEESLYYVMPHVDGESLRQRLTREGALPLASARRICQEIAGALDYAHRRGVVHRDIKPENILLQDGQAIVADFGIAHAIARGVAEAGTADAIPVIGTPAYMSPEQAAGSPTLDGRTDVYALGCVLYEMLAGCPAFTGPTAQAVMASHTAGPAPSPEPLAGLPPAVMAAVGRALQPSPADRFDTAGEFVQALDTAAAAPPRPVSSLGGGRRRLLKGLAVSMVAGLVLGRGLLHRPASPPVDARLVAVLPFRVEGASAELAWLREGMIDLLAIKLRGTGGLHAADPQMVLSAWRQAGGSAGRSLAPPGAIEVAHRLGAGRAIQGGVVGTAGHLTLTASLLGRTGGEFAPVTVEGPAESLPVLVDRLAGGLLSLDAGTEASRLSSLASASLPAIRAYLDGRAAFRSGHADEALRRFREATQLDSTFALAALELVHASIWVPARHGFDMAKGKRLALAGRDRLSAADQALLDVWAGSLPTATEFFRRRVAATSVYPNLSETWYALGDGYFHYGMSAGLDDPLRLAAEAFQRGWAIDSAAAGNAPDRVRAPVLAEPLDHMVELAQLRGDTASVRRLVAQGLAVDTAAASQAHLRWHEAALLGDSARHAFWAGSSRMTSTQAAIIAADIEWTGPASQAYLRAVNADYLLAATQAIRYDEVGDPAPAAFGRGVLALNGGRPREAARFRYAGDTAAAGLRQHILDALYWGADTNGAAEAARRLAPYASGPTVGGDTAAARLDNLCVLATWRAAHADYQYTEAAIARLRGARVTGRTPNDSIGVTWNTTLCATLLDATRATALRLPGARAKLEQADAAARSIIFVSHLAPNLVVARLAEMQGDLPLALRALRRRAGGYFIFPWYLSTFLGEEGRLAALTGDTASSIRAYEHYLAVRPDPEPAARPEVERVRRELAAMRSTSSP